MPLIWPLELFLKVQKANLWPFFCFVTDRQTPRGIEAPSQSLKMWFMCQQIQLRTSPPTTGGLHYFGHTRYSRSKNKTPLSICYRVSRVHFPLDATIFIRLHFFIHVYCKDGRSLHFVSALMMRIGEITSSHSLSYLILMTLSTQLRLFSSNVDFMHGSAAYFHNSGVSRIRDDRIE